MEKQTRFEKQLNAAGYKLIRAVATREIFGFDPIIGHVKRPAKTGKWFEVEAPCGEQVLLLRQGPNCFHTFGKACWTASGSSLQTACTHGLGDAIDSDSQLATYKRLVRKAPESLADKYAGLNAAKQQVYS